MGDGSATLRAWLVLGLRHLLVALQFYTRLPLPQGVQSWVRYHPDLQRHSTGHLPAVGVLVGAAMAAVLCGVHRCLPPVSAGAWVAAVCALLVGVWITGALHEDALADTADGLGGTWDRDRAMAIMKDPHTGVFGVLALVLALLLKVGLLALLLQEQGWRAGAMLWMAQVVSRLAPVCCLASLPYVRAATQSKAQALVAGTPRSVVWVAVVWTALGVGCLVWWAVEGVGLWLGGLATCAVASMWMWRLQRRRLGGCTGDTLGATQQVAEMAFLLGCALGVGWS